MSNVRRLKRVFLGAPALVAATLMFVLSPGSGGMQSDVAHAQVYYFPDLIVELISDAQQPFDCVTPAGVNVTVRNIGGLTAGPSTTYVSSTYPFTSQSLATPSLAPGQAVTISSTVQGLPIGDTYTATADYGGGVAESDETNNSLSAIVSLATLPTCTATPIATPTSVPTSTPTPAPAVGGVSLDSQLPGSSGPSEGPLAALVAAGITTIGGAAWWARRRLARG